MGVCAKCKYFRGIRSPSQLLAKAFGTSEGAVATALAKVVEDEQKVRDVEAAYKRTQASTEHMSWTTRPLMSKFCGLEEGNEIYLIAEIKNVGSRCTQFNSDPPERRSCSDCAHRVVPDGRSRDRNREQTYSGMAVANMMVEKGSTSTADALLNKHRESVGSRKSFEISGAYFSQGKMGTKPEYLDYCGLFSTEDEFVVCTLQNPHNSCSSWKGNVPAIITVATVPPREDLPSARQSTCLHCGLRHDALNPCATKYQQMIDHFKSLMQKPVTAKQLTRAAKTLTAGWWGLGTRWHSRRAQAAGSKPAEEDRALVQASKTPLAQGNPPLTREMAECFFESVRFALLLKCVELDFILVQAEMKEKYIKELAANYDSAPSELKAWMGGLPLEWPKAMAVWNDLPKSKRDFFKPILKDFSGPDLVYLILNAPGIVGWDRAFPLLASSNPNSGQARVPINPNVPKEQTSGVPNNTQTSGCTVSFNANLLSNSDQAKAPIKPDVPTAESRPDWPVHGSRVEEALKRFGRENKLRQERELRKEPGTISGLFAAYERDEERRRLRSQEEAKKEDEIWKSSIDVEYQRLKKIDPELAEQYEEQAWAREMNRRSTMLRNHHENQMAILKNRKW